MSGAQPAVLITGAGGALGGAVVAHFAQRGARLVLLERDGTALRRQWGAGSGAQAEAAQLAQRAAQQRLASRQAVEPAAAKEVLRAPQDKPVTRRG